MFLNFVVIAPKSTLSSQGCLMTVVDALAETRASHVLAEPFATMPCLRFLQLLIILTMLYNTFWLCGISLSFLSHLFTFYRFCWGWKPGEQVCWLRALRWSCALSLSWGLSDWQICALNIPSFLLPVFLLSPLGAPGMLCVQPMF